MRRPSCGRRWYGSRPRAAAARWTNRARPTWSWCYQREAGLLAHTFALDWLHAHAQVGRTRRDALRDVGDRCLLVAGLFPGLARRRRVSVDYFVDLGRGAYREVAEAGRSAYDALFGQLAQDYRQLVAVLSGLRGQGANLAWQRVPQGATRH